MLLSDIDKNDTAVITDIFGGHQFIRRLISFGITKGTQFKLKEVTIMRNVFEIEVEDGTCVALRKGEASKIEVELCK